MSRSSGESRRYPKGRAQSKSESVRQEVRTLRGNIVGAVLWAGLVWPLSGQVPTGRFSVCGAETHVVVEGLPDTSFVSANAARSEQVVADSTRVWGQNVLAR
jgi:hypothetical protein